MTKPEEFCIFADHKSEQQVPLSKLALVKIGERIRNLRLSSDLTQEELAERADLAKSFISQLERDQVSISLDNLLEILRVLNIKVGDFFREVAEEKVVYDHEERTGLIDTGADKFELLIPGGTNRKMEAAHVELLPGQQTYPVKPFQGEAFGFILKGILTLRFGGEKHTAHVGDSFYFSGEREHILENTSRRPVEFIWVTTPPMF
ncbi:helix-turn-helix domain-containing protein [candidate division KSB1 bacterium]|nr:MAG: helix-turn-helix domain-containing protein [candidate division KSB1 bacterium]